MASDGYSASSVSEQQPLTSPAATEEKASTNAPIKEDGDGNGSNGGSGEGAKGSKVSRKRTKTGCLSALTSPSVFLFCCSQQSKARLDEHATDCELQLAENDESSAAKNDRPATTASSRSVYVRVTTSEWCLKMECMDCFRLEEWVEHCPVDFLSLISSLPHRVLRVHWPQHPRFPCIVAMRRSLHWIEALPRT
jgi:hypothetical protein